MQCDSVNWSKFVLSDFACNSTSADPAAARLSEYDIFKNWFGFLYDPVNNKHVEIHWNSVASLCESLLTQRHELWFTCGLCKFSICLSCCCLLPWSSQIDVRLISYSKLVVGVDVGVNGSLSVLLCFPCVWQAICMMSAGIGGIRNVMGQLGTSSGSHWSKWHVTWQEMMGAGKMQTRWGHNDRCILQNKQYRIREQEDFGI